MKAIYLGLFDSIKRIESEFEVSGLKNSGVKILLAWYEYEDYSGDAYVLFEQDGKLFEVYGSHCSCYGLEGQWGPEETSVAFLEHRIEQGKDYCLDCYRQHLIKVVKALKKKGEE